MEAVERSRYKELVERLKRGEISHTEYMSLVDKLVKESAKKAAPEQNSARNRRIEEAARIAREI